MVIYRYQLNNNKIEFEIFEDVSKDVFEYYDSYLPSNIDTICNIDALDSNEPITVNYPSDSICAQFYSTPQELSDVKQRFINDILYDIEREKDRFYNFTENMNKKLLKMQEIEI